MRTIIAGSRTITDYGVLLHAISEMPWKITHVISGGAKGVDLMGERWAKENGIPFQVFKPDWSQGRGAGYARNAIMAQYAEAALILWNGTSKGTGNMISIARAKHLVLYVHDITGAAK